MKKREGGRSRIYPPRSIQKFTRLQPFVSINSTNSSSRLDGKFSPRGSKKKRREKKFKRVAGGKSVASNVVANLQCNVIIICGADLVPLITDRKMYTCRERRKAALARVTTPENSKSVTFSSAPLNRGKRERKPRLFVPFGRGVAARRDIQ